MKFYRNFKFLIRKRKWVIYTRNKQITYYRRTGTFTGAFLLLFLTISLSVWSIAARYTEGPEKRLPVDRQSDWKSFVTKFKPLNSTGTIKSTDNKGSENQNIANTAVHQDIITTVFWIGESADASNNFISNSASAWDGNWQAHYGGIDNPEKRQGYYPASFTPKENPFYVALPYNDLNNFGLRKDSAGACPNSRNNEMKKYSWCKNAWLAISSNGKTVYAQWEDVGPLEEDDVKYVFGNSAPKNTWGMKAGLDVSPAVRDYLGLQDVDKTDWKFVSATDVPSGPWKKIVTTDKGYMVNS